MSNAAAMSDELTMRDEAATSPTSPVPGGQLAPSLYQPVAAVGDLAAAGRALGLAEEIAALRVLLAGVIAGLARRRGGRIPVAQVEAVSRIMGRLGRLLLADRKASGSAADQAMSHLLPAIRALGKDVGRDLG